MTAGKKAPEAAGKTLPEMDFSEIAHGVEILAQHLADPDRRRLVGEVLMNDVEGMTGDAAEDFRRAVYGCMWFGDSIAPVRAALSELAIHSAGAATATLVDRQKRLEAAAHGRKGGRPPSEYDDDWLRMFDDKRSRNPALSKSELCRRIATGWRDENGNSRSARTIEAGITRAQKVRRKPPFPR